MQLFANYYYSTLTGESRERERDRPDKKISTGGEAAGMRIREGEGIAA